MGLDDAFDALRQAYDGSVPGAAILVQRDGEPIACRAFGLADLERGVPVTPTTNFRLASVTKQFTAAAVLLLAEEGRLRLHDRVRAWLPSLPPAAEPMTLRQLLTHTSGLVDYEDLVPASRAWQLRDADVLRLLESEDRTLFPPGTGWRYSNGGYALLALVVERASGQGFARFLHDRIFEPLGMSGTVAHEEGISTVRDRAFGYGRRGGAWELRDQGPTTAVLGDGGIYASALDLAKWESALHDDRLLGAESRRQAFAPDTASGDPAVRYGFGWRITGDLLWHSGESIGFRTVIVRQPATRLAVVILTNRDEGEPLTAARALIGASAGAKMRKVL